MLLTSGMSRKVSVFFSEILSPQYLIVERQQYKGARLIRVW